MVDCVVLTFLIAETMSGMLSACRSIIASGAGMINEQLGIVVESTYDRL